MLYTDHYYTHPGFASVVFLVNYPYNNSNTPLSATHASYRVTWIKCNTGLAIGPQDLNIPIGIVDQFIDLGEEFIPVEAKNFSLKEI